MALYEDSETKKILIEQAQRICLGEITDDVLIRLYARFSQEKVLKDNPDYKNNNFARTLPTMLKISDKKLTKTKTSKEYKEAKEKFLSLCPTPYDFLKFGIPGTIKDFTLARNVLEDMGFSLLQTNPYSMLLLPLVVLNANANDSDSRLYDITKNELQNSVDTSKIKKERYLLFLAAMRGYARNPQLKAIKELPNRVESRSKAYNAIRIMKNELQLSFRKQIELCDIYYHSSPLAQTARTLYKALKEKDYQFTQNKSDIKNILVRLCSEFKTPKAQMVLEGIYQIKKDESHSLLEMSVEKRINDNRKLSTEIECSFAYDVFTEIFSQDDSILVVFPSPFFVRKWTEDNLVNPFKVTFVVPTIEEKNLWGHIFVNKEAGKNITVHTPGSLIFSLKKKQITFNKVLALMLDYEESPLDFPNQEKNPYNLCLSLLKYCKDADIYCLSSNDAFKVEKSFSHTFIENNLHIGKIIFLPNCLESTGPKKKNLWIGNITTSKGTTFGHISRQEKSFLIVEDTPKYEFSLSGFLKERKRSLLAYAKNPVKKEKNKKNEKALFYEFSPEITFKYTVSPDYHYPDKLRVTAFYDNINIEQKQDKDIKKEIKKEIKKKTTKTALIYKEEIGEWIEKVYPYSVVTKGKKQGEGRSIRSILSDHLRKTNNGEPVSLKTLLYIHPEYEKDFSEEQLNILYTVAKTDIGNEEINTILMETIEETLVASETDIDTKLLEITFEDLYALAAQDHNVTVSSLYGTEFNHAKTIIDRRLVDVRSALATKTFTKEQAKKFCEILQDKIAQDDAACLGLLIKFFTGLETAAISVLKKEDWKEIKDYGGHQLQIYKILQKKPQEGQEAWEMFHSQTKFRSIPCSNEIDEAIANWVKRKKIMGLNYLLSGDDTIVTPQKINTTFRQIMKEMDLEKIAEQNIDEISISLSDYGGDFLRENFRFMASEFAGMNADEIAFLLGNIPQTTFGIHYCDYQNPSSQHLLHTKLNRIGYILKKSLTFQKPKTVRCKANAPEEFVNEKSVFPIQLNSIIDNTKDEPCNITIESDYGVKIYITEEPI